MSTTATKPNMNMLDKMLVLAVTGHAGQFDRGGQPYILHTLAVMHRLRTTDQELQCIAAGHDLIEDNKKMTYKLLVEEGMSSRVVEGIRCLTRVPGESEEEYQAKVMSNIDSMRVKLEDVRHNSDIRRLKGVTEKDVARIIKYHAFWLRLKAAITEYDKTGKLPNAA